MIVIIENHHVKYPPHTLGSLVPSDVEYVPQFVIELGGEGGGA